jgi:hypothetical protein
MGGGFGPRPKLRRIKIMKFKVSELFNSIGNLKKLNSVQWPVLIGLRLRRYRVNVEKELEVLDPERIKIFDKYDVPKTEKGIYDLQKFVEINQDKPEAIKGLETDFNTFWESEVEVDIISTKMEDLEKVCSDVKGTITPDDFANLEKFFI